MIEQPNDNTGIASEREEIIHAGLMPQMKMMFRALWASPLRSRLMLLAGAILLIIIVTAYGQTLLNQWNRPFYDALSHRDLGAFVHQLGVFCLIAGALLVLNVAQRWLAETLKLNLRAGLVHDLIHEWTLPMRAFRLANAGPIGVNPDQRMHEDARHLTELSADLGIGLLQASILLIIFVSVLWALSDEFVFHFGGREYALPGFMVWAAFIYAGSASLLSYWAGRSLIDRNAERYGREAELRYSLVRVNEHIDAISLARGETDEARRVELDLQAVLGAMRSLVRSLTNLTWITAGYGWFTIIAPILVAAPIYFAGRITFGGLMMAVGAFSQVQSSLRWFVDNFSAIADWRATLLRVASFRRALLLTDNLHAVEKHITLVDGAPGQITIDRLEIASPSGCAMLEETHVQIRAGERILILGEPGTGKTLLFRALAGLWPWGAGRIERPKGEQLLYMPRTPYLPPGTLREVLAYPMDVDGFSERAFVNALARLRLKRLTPMLDTARRWERELSEEEQQRLAFARLVLQSPRWVLIDEMLDQLDDDTLARVMEIFTKDMPQMGVIHIGRGEHRKHLYSRVLHLINDPTIRRLARLKITDVRRPKQKNEPATAE
jgi:putative ATP-binding cassette transporter